MRKVSKAGVFIWVLYFIAPSTQAEITFNGFASAGGAFFDVNNGAYPDNEFTEDEFSSDPINKIALQSSATINDQISVTGQLLAKGSNQYTVEAEWAYLTFSPRDDLGLRFGRLRSPLFAYSDYLDVGYAYPWITPPGLVYRFSFDTVEGMDAIYSMSAFNWDISYQVFYGRLTDEQELFGELLPIDIQNFSGFNFSVNRDWFTFRASYNRATFDIATPNDNAELNTLFAALNSPIGPFPAYPEVVDALEMEKEKAVFYGASAQIQYSGWVFNTEYTALEVSQQSFISDDSAWYAMLGKQLGPFLLHATYSKHKDAPDFAFVSGLSAMDPRQAGAKSAVLNSETSQTTLGVRYDFADSTAFKFEASQTDDKKSDREAQLVAFSIDTVF